MISADWHVLVLAAGRGPDDPMASAYGLANKCLLEVGGRPMIQRVVDALAASALAHRPVIVTEAVSEMAKVIPQNVTFTAPAGSAPGSVLKALRDAKVHIPLLITTGDHALLTAEMIDHFLAQAEKTDADFCVALACEEVIRRAYPHTKRTYFRLGPDRVSGCNLFALRDPRALVLLERWQNLEQVRKKPWRLVSAFGLGTLVAFALGRLTLERAFVRLSAALGMTARPVLMPFAEAAIDVDKPADKDLAEEILKLRDSSPAEREERVSPRSFF